MGQEKTNQIKCGESMRNMLEYIYSRRLVSVWIIIILMVFVWAGTNACSKSRESGMKTMRSINLLLFVIQILAVLYITVISRKTGIREFCIVPLYSFVIAKIESEVYRAMLMNVLLFVPLGLTMPYILKGTYKKRLLVLIMNIFFFSAGIEITQYIFGLGKAEVDDVICNVIGAIIGSMAYLISEKLTKMRDSL